MSTMTGLRLLELLFYCVANLVPGVLLMCIACKKILRFNRVITTLLSVMLLLVYLSCTASYDAGILSYITANLIINASYVVFALILTKQHFGLLLFILGISLNYGSVCGITSEGIYNVINLRYVRFGYWSSLITIIVSALFFILYYRVLVRKFVPIFMRNEYQKEWDTMWLVPVFFCFVHYYCIWTQRGDYAKDPFNVISLIMINIGSLMICYFVAFLVEQTAIRQSLEADRKVNNMQKRHYEDIQDSLVKTRQTRHDLRQHLRLIQSYLDSGDVDVLREYVKSYSQSLPEIKYESYCENETINTIVNYYAAMAKEKEIDFEAAINAPADLFISDPELCVVIGNLLENSVEAGCRYLESAGASDKARPFVRIHARDVAGATLIITVDNGPALKPTLYYDIRAARRSGTSADRRTSANERRTPFPGGGEASASLYFSSKHDSAGIGIASVRSIAAKYNGRADFEWKDGTFSASVLVCNSR